MENLPQESEAKCVEAKSVQKDESETKGEKNLKKTTDPQIIWVLGHKSFSNIAVNLRKISIETS